MELNKNKCGVLNIRKRKNQNANMEPIMGIPQVTEYKYLGIYLDEKMNFKYHLEYLKNKVLQRAK